MKMNTQQRVRLKPKVVVVMPAYNAANTLKKTYRDIPKDLVDEIIGESIRRF